MHSKLSPRGLCFASAAFEVQPLGFSFKSAFPHMFVRKGDECHNFKFVRSNSTKLFLRLANFECNGACAFRHIGMCPCIQTHCALVFVRAFRHIEHANIISSVHVYSDTLVCGRAVVISIAHSAKLDVCGAASNQVLGRGCLVVQV